MWLCFEQNNLVQFSVQTPGQIWVQFNNYLAHSVRAPRTTALSKLPIALQSDDRLKGALRR